MKPASKRPKKRSADAKVESGTGAASKQPEIEMPASDATACCQTRSWWSLALGIAIPLVFAWFSIRFVDLEKGAIYLSDFATYWSQVVSIANDIRARGVTLDLLNVLYDSVGKNHYNSLPTIPLVPFQFLGIGSRSAFIGAIGFLFLGAAAHACGRLVLRHLKASQANCIALVCGGLAMVSTCSIWWPVYRGYVDASAMACALGSIAILFGHKQAQTHPVRAIFAGFLLGLCVLLRAYFGFYAISFCLLLTIDVGVKFFRAPNAALKKELLQFICAFALGAALNAAIFPKFVSLSLSMDHGIHAAFLSDRSFLGDLWYLLTYFGAVFTALSILGVWCYIRKIGFSSALWIPLGASALGGLLFLRDQFFGEHHRSLLLVGLLSSIMLALGVALSQPKARLHIAFLVVFGVACLGCISDLHGAGSKGVFNGMTSPEPLSGEPPTRSKLWVALFGFASPRPMARSDSAELARMYAYLDDLISKDPNARIYVLASGWSLSDMVIYASLLPSPGLQFRSVRNLLPVHQVDSRDGVPSNLLAATYVLTSETLETHLKPGTQKCIEVPWQQFHEERGYARGFEPLRERFELEKGVKALVFKRTRPSFPLEVRELEQDLRAAGMVK